MKHLLALIVSLVTIGVLASACAAEVVVNANEPSVLETPIPPAVTPADPDEPDEPPLPIIHPSPLDAGQIVMQVTRHVNQPDPIAVSLGYPMLTLFGDGRAVVVDEREPAGVVPMSEVRLRPADMARLIALAESELDDPGTRDDSLADADAISLMVGLDHGSLHNSGERRLIEFVRSLPAGTVYGRLEPLDHDHMLVIGAAFPGPAGPDTPVLPVDLSAASNHEGRVSTVWCIDVSGDELAAFRPLLGGVSRFGSTWQIEGQQYRVGFRPVFAGESGCSVIGGL